MSSKILNKKSDDKNDKAEKEALKEVEIVAELAPNEKTRKEAEKLIENCGKWVHYIGSGARTRSN